MNEAVRPITADDLAVTLAVRDDLGPGHEPAVIGEFLDRVGSAIDARVDAKLAAVAPPRSAGGHRSRPELGFFSLVFGIPITAISASQGLGAMLIAWGGIAAVNLADALRR